MAYVEKVKWEKVKESEHGYDKLDSVLKSMGELNPFLSIASSELFDENEKLIATYKKGEGVKIMKPTITVKKGTLHYLQNNGIAQIMRDWRAWLNDADALSAMKQKAFNDLNTAMYDSSASDIIEFYISGAYDFIPVEKEYQIILPEVMRSGSGALWPYMFVGLTEEQKPVINYTDSKERIYTFPESKLKHFPKWAQELAKEVE